MQAKAVQLKTVHSKIVRWFSVSCLLVLMGALSSCVTEKEGKSNTRLDKEKALDLEIRMALGYIENGSREKARQHLDKAFQMDSGSAQATEAMAKLYILEGETKLADDEFKKAIRLDKKFTQAYSSYGIFLFNQKRYEEALAQFEIAAADLGYNNRSAVLTNLGKTAIKLGNKARAESAFGHAVILDRKNADAYLELADINLNKQEYAAAKNNLDMFESLAGRSSRSLLLGIRLERIFGNKDKEASLVLFLKNEFPYSKEYLEYKNTMKN